MLLWKRYGNNKMAAMRYYSTSSTYSRGLNLFYLSKTDVSLAVASEVSVVGASLLHSVLGSNFEILKMFKYVRLT